MNSPNQSMGINRLTAPCRLGSVRGLVIIGECGPAVKKARMLANKITAGENYWQK